jgi:3-oxoacyl-[acyl-carrier protein] reductase
VNLEVEGKLFVVCGASRGLGRAVAETLLAEGARVHVVARNPDAEALGPGATGSAADLSTSAGVATVATWAHANGPIDGVLVNGGGPPAGRALELSEEQWQLAFSLLLLGPLRLLRELSDDLADPSSVLFVTSSSVRQPIPALDTSNVLRPAVAALVKTLAIQLAPRTRVNSLAPGRFDTDRVRELDRGRASAAGISLEEQRARTSAAIPLGRYGEPGEFGRLAAFLLSPAASYVNGAAIQADGGLVTSIP